MSLQRSGAIVAVCIVLASPANRASSLVVQGWRHVFACGHSLTVSEQGGSEPQREHRLPVRLRASRD